MTPAEIRATRVRLGLTQAALARALGLPDPPGSGQVQISRWERGVYDPPPYLALALREIERDRLT